MTAMVISGVAQQSVVEHDLLANLISGVRSTFAWPFQEEDFSRQLSRVTTKTRAVP